MIYRDIIWSKQDQDHFSIVILSLLTNRFLMKMDADCIYGPGQ